MQRQIKGIRQRFQRMNLTQRLSLSLVLVVIATVIFVGIPAEIVMWHGLEKQVWLRVQDAQSATQGLYDAEITRLKKLAGLIAGRPTLYNLVLWGNNASSGESFSLMLIRSSSLFACMMKNGLPPMLQESQMEYQVYPIVYNILMISAGALP